MSTIFRKVLTYFILPVCIAGLVYLNVKSISEPVEFKKHREYRESVAVQRLKDIRDLQVAFKNVNGRYSPTIDSLKMFYGEGKMKIVMQVGSKDDSVAVEHTKQMKNKFRNLKGEQLNRKLNELYLAGDKDLVFQVNSEVAFSRDVQTLISTLLLSFLSAGTLFSLLLPSRLSLV